jgi:hypothetical protein
MPKLKVVTIEGATQSGDRAAPGRSEFIQALQDFMKSNSMKK